MAKGTEKSVAPVTELSVLEKVLIEGDLSVLNPEERYMYYTKVCESLGLNPLTKPFDYLRLNGKLVLYVKKDATDQLRKLHKISITISNREKIGDVYCVTARGTTPDARTDESIGAVPLQKREAGKLIPLVADEMANALMKAEAKAKRRVTLSLVGLGMMDEAEIESVENAERIIVNEEPLAPHPSVESSQTESEKQSEQPSKTSTTEPTSDTSESRTAGESPVQDMAATPATSAKYRLLDAKTGASPSGTVYAQLRIENLASSEQLVVIAKEKGLLDMLDSIKNDSEFELVYADENGFKIVNSIRILGTAA